MKDITIKERMSLQKIGKPRSKEVREKISKTLLEANAQRRRELCQENNLIQ